MTKYPPYTPMSSLGRELGIMFAFIGACLLAMAVYSFAWRAHQRRVADQDLRRRRAFHARAGANMFHNRDSSTNAAGLNFGTTVTVTSGGAVDRPVHEKMLDRYAMPANRVELPVHGVVAMDEQVSVGDTSRHSGRKSQSETSGLL